MDTQAVIAILEEKARRSDGERSGRLFYPWLAGVRRSGAAEDRNGKPTMVMQGNTAPDFTLETDRDRDLSAEQVVVAYHERTKPPHHRHAASLGYMDWAKQPDPFRRYDGASLVLLPFPA